MIDTYFAEPAYHLTVVTINFVPPTQHTLQIKSREHMFFRVLSVHITGFVSYNEIYMLVYYASGDPCGWLLGVTFIVHLYSLGAKVQYNNLNSICEMFYCSLNERCLNGNHGLNMVTGIFKCRIRIFILFHSFTEQHIDTEI